VLYIAHKSCFRRSGWYTRVDTQHICRGPNSRLMPPSPQNPRAGTCWLAATAQQHRQAIHDRLACCWPYLYPAALPCLDTCLLQACCYCWGTAESGCRHAHRGWTKRSSTSYCGMLNAYAEMAAHTPTGQPTTHPLEHLRRNTTPRLLVQGYPTPHIDNGQTSQDSHNTDNCTSGITTVAVRKQRQRTANTTSFWLGAVSAGLWR
jgi:hypothetical protein